MATTGTLSLIHAGVDQVDAIAAKRGLENYRGIVKVATDSQGYKEYALIAEFGDPTIVGEGQPIPDDNQARVFNFRIPQVKIAKRYSWTFEADKFDVYDQVAGAKLAGKISKSFRRFKNKVAANIYNNGFTNTAGLGKIYDDQALFSASHTGASGAAASITGGWSNTTSGAASALGPIALETALSSLWSQCDLRGEQMEFESNAKLIVPSALYPLAYRLVNSQGFPLTNNNDPNFAGPRLMLEWNRFLTSSTAWFLRNQSDDDHGLTLIQSQPLRLKQFDNGETASEYIQALEMYAAGVEMWQGSYGSAGA